MGNGTAAVLEPTFRGYVGSTTDALILFEACLTGVLSHVPRRPHDRERSQLVRSGSVFIYEENASGIKRWTDGVTWSPSRILGNFLVYRELDKPFPPGEKKRAMKKGTRRPPQPARPGEPYPRPQETNGSVYSPATPTPGPAIGERSQQSEIERALVGSLVDSYGFKEGGLVKKTMSVTLSGVTHHLVSYYSVEDVMRGALLTPSMNESLRYIRPRPELTTKQSFRAPIDDMDHGGMEETDPSQALYGYRSSMAPGYPIQHPTAGYYALPPGTAYAHPPPPPMASYQVGPHGMPPHPTQNPYMPSPASSNEVPPKAEDYAAYRNGPPPPPNPYGPNFDMSQQQAMSHMPPSMNPAARPPPPAAAYRTPSFSAGRSMDSSAAVDPNAPSNQPSYPRASFSIPGSMEGGQSQQMEPRAPTLSQAPFELAPRRDSAPYYNGTEARQQHPSPQSQQHPQHTQQQQAQQHPQQPQQQGQQLPPPQQQSPPRPVQHQAQPPPPPQTQQTPSQHPQAAHHPSQSHHYFMGNQGAAAPSVYHSGQQAMPTWAPPAAAPPPL